VPGDEQAKRSEQAENRRPVPNSISNYLVHEWILSDGIPELSV
jgi:hypothetical protein